MGFLDWIILIGTLGFIVWYGIRKSSTKNKTGDFIRGSQNSPWWVIGLSIMATQASAITFLSTPGLAFESGLGFVQFYFGLPIAMIIVAYVFVPVFHKLKVYTAYEYLETRFDLKTRLIGAFLFLLQRGLAAGITIYAPSIILTAVLGWPLNINILVIGTLVIVYTVSGGTEAVTQTHKQQMAVIFIGMIAAFGFLIYYITLEIPLERAWEVARISGKTKTINFDFDFENRYNIWSGIIGGTFLMLSYFGTDQSQVQRYLSGKSVKEIRIGLFFNGMIKIPMQYFILLTGVMVFVFYNLHQAPPSFNPEITEAVKINSGKENISKNLTLQHENFQLKRDLILSGRDLEGNGFKELVENEKTFNRVIKEESLSSANPIKKVKESDFVFIRFILDYLPVGLIGILLAVIFSAAMSSTAAELNALGTTTGVDFYKRLWKPAATDAQFKWFTRISTAFWGITAMGFAAVASLFDNLVEFVNILGSLFYGTVLGIFLAGFFVYYIKGRAVFFAALITQTFIILIYIFQENVDKMIGTKIAFLWYNLIGSMLVLIIGILLQFVFNRKTKPPGLS